MSKKDLTVHSIKGKLVGTDVGEETRTITIEVEEIEMKLIMHNHPHFGDQIMLIWARLGDD